MGEFLRNGTRTESVLHSTEEIVEHACAVPYVPLLIPLETTASATMN